ncbi:BON domain-containing protein [Variovorax guangxiensis]|uniref:BON domain-containing protein n=1 Tax=Variovorax guangxiensis TaxID=1775474 RepID=A0A502DXU6_9BURK|nr:MAG: BON domain-containing protein [Variovorax sp.]TPG24729.1 BON domain-containing protein [Variovorax ginsengisoli]TPG28980.1 BON domain-containing protein [Variovorax guangxiensis]
MKMTSIPRLVLTLTAGAALAAALSACVPLVVGGAAVGAGLVATDRRTSGAQLDDQGIELRGASRIREIANDQMNISVTSFNRQLLLTGTVATDADRRRAEAAVQGIDNVRSVVNEVRVGPGRSFQVRSNDTFITGKVKASLLDAKDLFANSFKIVTDDGVVYLMGLATRREVDRATDITRGVSGVQKVVRVVEVVSDAELAGQLRQGGTDAPAAAPSGSRVPLPPMDPVPAPASGGATITPVR